MCFVKSKTKLYKRYYEKEKIVFNEYILNKTKVHVNPLLASLRFECCKKKNQPLTDSGLVCHCSLHNAKLSEILGRHLYRLYLYSCKILAP